jgi:hypothetical protein
MKKYQIIGGVLVAYVGLNVAVGLYFGVPRHIKSLAEEEKSNPGQPRMSGYEMLAQAFERGFDERFGPVV